MKGFSFFEVDKKFEKEVLNGFKEAQYKGYKLSVELSKPDKKASKTTTTRKRYDNGRKRRKY
jgi:hypothetical protein